jgi:hypothetical protein
MNGMEAEYAVQLEARKRAGAIVAYWYEAQTMKLAHDTRYTPDFLVQLPNGEMELHEVKGFWREDAKIKAKVCASLYPYPVYIAQRMRGGGFTVQLVEA